MPCACFNNDCYRYEPLIKYKDGAEYPGRTTYEMINSIQAYLRVKDKDSYFVQMNDLTVYCVWTTAVVVYTNLVCIIARVEYHLFRVCSIYYTVTVGECCFCGVYFQSFSKKHAPKSLSYCSELAAITFILQCASCNNFYIAVCYLARILFTSGDFPTIKKDRPRFSEESNPTHGIS